MFLRSGVRTAQSLRNTLSSMPLRARINWPATGVSTMASNFSTARAPIKIDSLPEDPQGDVLFGGKMGVRTIELNRPSKLNALDASMCRKIVPRLQEWEKSALANVVVIKGAGSKAFCAGGDVMSLVEMIKANPENGPKQAAQYFALEYRLDHYISQYHKPYVAFMDGYTLGGGVGLSIHAPFRIATENTRFGMPETRIGFFPDVGGSFFLPRMDGEVGTYLALTSSELHGVANLYAGIATHYIHSTALPDLEERLSELQFKDFESYESRLRLVDSAIREFSSGLPPVESEPTVIRGEIREAIDRCFSNNSVTAIVKALENEKTEFADKTLKAMKGRSPTSLVVTLNALRQGKKHGIRDTFQREFILASNFMKHPDFVQGVTSQLTKNPDGSRKTAEWAVKELPMTSSETDAILAPFFEPAPGQERLTMLVSGSDYTAYPYPSLGLPSEAEVGEIVQKGGKTAKDVLNHFITERQMTEGMREKVYDILARRTKTDENGGLAWTKNNKFGF